MSVLFAATIVAAITAGFWFLWVCCTFQAIGLRTLDRHREAAVTNLIPLFACRSCRPSAPFAGLVLLSRTSIAEEMCEKHSTTATTNKPAYHTL